MNENNDLNNTSTPVTPVTPVEPVQPVQPVEPVQPAPVVEQPVQQIPEGAPALPTDNAPVQPEPIQPVQQPVEPVAQEAPQGDTTSDSNDKLFGVLSYIGFLSFIVLYVIKPKTDFALFHAKQGANLFLVELVLSVFGWLIVFILNLAKIPFAGTLVSLASTAVWVLSLIGLIWAAQGLKKELPVISSIKIIK